MRLFVGGIPYSTTEAELEQVFAACGAVSSVNIVTDRYSNQPRGFGFVDMPNEEDAKKAIRTLNGTVLGGRTIAVNEAKAREERGGGDRGGSRGSFGGGGGGGGNGGGGGRRY